MQRMGTSKNPVKQVTTWLAEKASRAKFTGVTSGEDELGTFMALEALTLGVEGKASLWRALIAVADRYPALGTVDLTGLLERAETQHATLEDERVAAATLALRGECEGVRVHRPPGLLAASPLVRSPPAGSLWHGPVERRPRDPHSLHPSRLL